MDCPPPNLPAKSQQLVLVLNPKCHNATWPEPMPRWHGWVCHPSGHGLWLAPTSERARWGASTEGGSVLAPHACRVTESAVPHPLPPVGTGVLLSQPPMNRGPWPSATGVTALRSHPPSCFEPDGVTPLPPGLAAHLPRNTQVPACSPSKRAHRGTDES